jgi:O-antigen/teichoic acid export membrane protein
MKENWLAHFKSTFFKNFYLVLSGSVLSQVVVIFTTPILSRIYSPEDFGAASVFFSVVGFFTILSTFQYEGAIMLPKRNIDSLALVILSTMLAFVSSIVIGIFLFFYHDVVFAWFHMESQSKFWEWIPVAIVVYAVYSILSHWVTRLGQYKTIAYRQFFQSVSQSVTKIILGKLSFVTTGLVVGTLLGIAASISILIKGRVKDLLRSFRLITWERIKDNAKKYHKFPKYTMIQGLMDTFQESLLLLVISALYGNAKLGMYTFTLALLQKPLQVIGASLGQVYFQDISKKFANEQEIYSDTIKLIKILLSVALLIYIPVVIFGPWIFDFFFGDNWWESGEIAQIMSLWLMLKLITSPISSIPNVTGHQRNYVLFTLIGNILPLLIVFTGKNLNWDFHRVLIVNYFLLSGLLLVYMRWILRLTKRTQLMWPNSAA